MLLEIFSGEIQAFLLILARVGTAIMVMPAFSEPFINMRARLAIALLLTLVVLPVLSDQLPPLSQNPFEILLLLLGETFVGLFIGLLARIMISALQTTGMILSMMIGLANALTQDITAAQQGSVVGSLLTTIGLLIIFVLNLHHLMLMAIINSYDVFIPGTVPVVEDFAHTIARVTSEAFKLGFQMAAPFVALALVFNTGLGIISRLMPTLQIFFVAIPLQIGFGLALLALSLPVIFKWFVTGFEARLINLVGP